MNKALKVVIISSVVLVILIAASAAYVYSLYIKSGKDPVKVANSPIVNKTLDVAVANTKRLDYSACSRDTECSWYQENQGHPPGETEDVISYYCATGEIKKICPGCEDLPQQKIQSENIDLRDCVCVEKKCAPYVVNPDVYPSSTPVSVSTPLPVPAQ